MTLNILTEILISEGCPSWIIEHSSAVYKKAMEIAENFTEQDIDLDLIKKAAILHDIGRSKTNDIDHGVIGAQIAIEHGFSEEIAIIIERHIGSGITKKEAIELGLPEKSYLPLTLEEKIVSHSDNLVHGSEEVDIDFVIEKWKKSLKNPDEAIARLKSTHEELVISFK